MAASQNGLYMRRVLAGLGVIVQGTNPTAIVQDVKRMKAEGREIPPEADAFLKGQMARLGGPRVAWPELDKAACAGDLRRIIGDRLHARDVPETLEGMRSYAGYRRGLFKNAYSRVLQAIRRLQGDSGQQVISPSAQAEGPAVEQVAEAREVPSAARAATQPAPYRAIRFTSSGLLWGPKGEAGGINLSSTPILHRRHGYAITGGGRYVDLGVPTPGDAVLLLTPEEGVGAAMRLPIVSDEDAAQAAIASHTMGWGATDPKWGGREVQAQSHRLAKVLEIARRPDGGVDLYPYEVGRFRAALENLDLDPLSAPAGLLLVAGLPAADGFGSRPAAALGLLYALNRVNIEVGAIAMILPEAIVRGDSLLLDPSGGRLILGAALLGATPFARPFDDVKAVEGAATAAGKFKDGIARIKMKGNGEWRGTIADHIVPTAIGVWWKDPATLADRLGDLLEEIARLPNESRLMAFLKERYLEWRRLIPGGGRESSGGGGGTPGEGVLARIAAVGGRGVSSKAAAAEEVKAAILAMAAGDRPAAGRGGLTPAFFTAAWPGAAAGLVSAGVR